MTDRPVRVAVYGTGRFAQATHLPNLSRIDGVEIAALCDINEDALREAAAQFGVSRTYTDAHEMLEAENPDALWSIVPAFARTDVEIAAAERGIQLFSEKPQAMDMALAKRIDAAVRKGGVISTVGFRERYRPIFQKPGGCSGTSAWCTSAFSKSHRTSRWTDSGRTTGRTRWKRAASVSSTGACTPRTTPGS